MRSFALSTTTLALLVGMVPPAFAAPAANIQRLHASSGPAYESRLPAWTVGYPQRELWPECRSGLSCTAAGYPNLHYDRESGMLSR